MNAKPIRKAVFLISALLLACAEKVIEPPEDLIPQDTMTEILYDLSLLNATSAVSNGTLKDNGIEVMPYLFDKYGIDSLRFVSSDQYYASVPLTYETMYTEIQTRLEKEVKQVEDLRKQRSDSIRKQVDRRKDTISDARGGKTAPAVPSKK